MQRQPLLMAVLMTLLSLFGCATRPSFSGAEAGNDFVIERDLEGRTVGRGVFKAITGVNRPFTAYLDGSWDGTTFTLVEDFEFDDGEKDTKTWRLTKQVDGTYKGTREDVVGEALGFTDNGGLRLEYFIELIEEGKTSGRKVKFRDILYKNDEGIVVNRATVGWFGLRVGSVELEIKRNVQDVAVAAE